MLPKSWCCSKASSLAEEKMVLFSLLIRRKKSVKIGIWKEERGAGSLPVGIYEKGNECFMFRGPAGCAVLRDSGVVKAS